MSRITPVLLAALAMLNACGGLDPAVEDSVVLLVEREGGYVPSDAALSSLLSGRMEVTSDAATAAACHSLLGHAGDWSVGPALVVAQRADLVRVAEIVVQEAFDRLLVEKIEGYLFTAEANEVDENRVARGSGVSAGQVAAYLKLRRVEPAAGSFNRYVVYVQNVTHTMQRMVFVNRDRLAAGEGNRLLAGQYSSVDYTVAGSTNPITLEGADCAPYLRGARAG